MKNTLALFIATLTILFSNESMALTEKDCRERVNNAMYNSDRLGGNDADAYRWAQNAANECFKEIASNRSSSASNYSNSSSGSGASIFFSLLVLAGIGYFMFRPRTATEGEARSAYRKIAELYKPNPSDPPALAEYKKETLEGMPDGLNYLLEQIKNKDPFITQYFVKSMVNDGLADLKKREQEIRENGKIKTEISRKICRDRKCRTINTVDATSCSACGKPLPSADEIIADIEKYEEQRRHDKKIIEEQNGELKKGLSDFGLLIERRARASDETQLARVCQAYITGKLNYHTPQYFDYSDRDKIYTRLDSDGLFDDINFPVDPTKAEQIAIEAIRSIYTTPAKKGKEKLWEDKVRKIYGWTSFFTKESSTDSQKNSYLYKTIKDTDKDLFQQIQATLSKYQAEVHARALSTKKLPYSSARDSILATIPFPNEITPNTIEESDKFGEDLHTELRIKREKRAANKNKNA